MRATNAALCKRVNKVFKPTTFSVFFRKFDGLPVGLLGCHGYLLNWMLVAGIHLHLTTSQGVSHVQDSVYILGAGGVALAVLATLIYRFFNADRWRADVEADFEAALKRMHVDKYEFLVNRTTAPSFEASAASYRILLDQKGQYFLYMLVEGTTGQITTLSKERALIAAKMHGYVS
ncbi:hypothetical protein ACIPL1_24620 [Pseudomonas sp. NPDC090202]|uniref:hypothetical protein n=1 Tax=unclassified Pseudomonas TaxID=196821 RepID=UPI0037F3AC4F